MTKHGVLPLPANCRRLQHSLEGITQWSKILHAFHQRTCPEETIQQTEFTEEIASRRSHEARYQHRSRRGFSFSAPQAAEGGIFCGTKVL